MDEKTTVRTELAERLIKLRKAKGLNSRQASEAIGIDYQNYRKYETVALPKVDGYIKIADFYDVSIDYLMGRKIDYKLKPNNGDKVIKTYNGSMSGNLELRQQRAGLKVVENDLGELSTFEIMLIQKLRKISSEDKNDVAIYVNEKKDVE